MTKALVLQRLLQVAGAADGRFQILSLAGFAEVLVCCPNALEDEVGISMSREDKPHRLGKPLPNLSQELGTVHSGHSHVCNDHIKRKLGHEFEGLLAALDECHVPFAIQRAKRPPQSFE